jgi:catechol 2,3-dioxygenase-like lactoylglutathione lyase family enzyme
VAVLKTVAHTGITVRGLDKSIAFWRDVLGFEVRERLRQGTNYRDERARTSTS